MFLRLWHRWTRLRDWILDGVWDRETAGRPLPERLGLRGLRIVSLVWRGLHEDACQTRAWALTSITLLSIVPFLAFVFSFGKGLGIRSVVEAQLREFFPGPRPVAAVELTKEERDGLVEKRLKIDRLKAEGEAEKAAPDLTKLRADALALIDARRKGLEAERTTLRDSTDPDAADRLARIGAILDGDRGRQADVALAEAALEAARRRGAPPTEIETLRRNLRTQLRGVEVIGTILAYVDRTPVEALGAIGFLVLLWTFLKVLGTVEQSFNQIWGVRRARVFYRKFTDYVSVSLVGLLALAIAAALNVTLSTGTVAAWIEKTLRAGLLLRTLIWLMPTITTCVGFTFVYFFMPNTRVRIDSAALGGILAGALFQLTQWAFIHFQVGVSRYNAIYGAFATFPMFVFWLYLAWLIVLVGAEVAFAHQHVGTYAQEKRTAEASEAVRERVALEVAIQVAKRFQRGGPPPTADEIAEAAAVPVRLVNHVAWMLSRKGILVPVEGRDGALAPARALERVSAADVIEAVRTHGDNRVRPGPLEPEIDLALRRYGEAIQGALGSLTLKELAERETGDRPAGSGT